MPRIPGRAPDLAQQLWLYLAQRTGVEPRLARHVWRQLAASPDSLALRYAFTQALQAGRPGSPARYEAAAALVEGLGSPVSIMGALEELVKERRLSRRECTIVEECLLRLITRSGTWK